MDRRFAIVIGIDDYEQNPLDFCVNDAEAISKILEEKCAFGKEDIYIVSSQKTNPVKDISGHLNSSLEKIRCLLKPKKDSIFFFFAGHGKFQFNKSTLKFHDSYIEIAHIFEMVNILEPKYQCYVIDACESGGKVLLRGEKNNDALINEYISNSSGVLFMFASTEHEKAKELAKHEHGLFTHHFLNAINATDNYDQDGILTPNRIQDYIARETSKDSEFMQTPVVENRTQGYYPFAFLEGSKTILEEDSLKLERTSADMKSKTMDGTYFPNIPVEIRDQVFEDLQPKLDEYFKSVQGTFSDQDYKITLDSQIDFGSQITDPLTNSIVEEARKVKVNAVSGLFTTERHEVQQGSLFGGSMISAMINRNKAKYEYNNSISWYDDRLIFRSLDLKSNDVYKVSCGYVAIVFQSIYGIGLAESTFQFEFTGYNESGIKALSTNISAFKISNQTNQKIVNQLNAGVSSFKKRVENWNLWRKEEIEEFDKKSK